MTATIQTLELADRSAVDDLRILLGRLARVGEPEARLQSRGSVLAVYGCTQAPLGLTDDTPVVLVMRAFALAAEPRRISAPHVSAPHLSESGGSTPGVDEVVPVRALADRLARMGDAELSLALPDATTSAAWAGVLPPRSGWMPRGSIDAASLAGVAAEGMARVAAAVPVDAGEPVVQRVRRAVWGAEVAPGVPAAVAFAAEGLGFLSGVDRLAVSGTRTWTRFSGRNGHVLVRRSSLG